MPDDPVPARLHLIVTITAITAAAIPSIALAGWFLDLAVLRGVLPGAIAMNPVTAVALLALAMALALAGRRDRQTVLARRGLGVAAALIGAGRLADGLGIGDFRLDLLMFGNQLVTLDPVPRMAYSTAVCLLGAGIALALHRDGVLTRGRVMILPAAVFALFAATGYIYGAEWFYSIPALKPMALNSALALIALSVGVTALSPPLFPTSRMVADGVGGATARRLIPAAFFIPFLLGYFRVYAERAGWVDLGLGTAMFVVLTALALAGLAYYSAVKVQQEGETQALLDAEVRASERRLFRILEALPLGIFVTTPDGRPYYANRRSTEISGIGILPDADAGSLSVRYGVYRSGTDDLYPAEELPVARALRDERVYTADIDLVRDERRIPVEVWAEPVKDDAGRTEYAISVYNDISSRLEAERRIRQLNHELQHQVHELAAVNRELETFSYSVSHDLRAPLRAVDGFSKILESDHGTALDPEARRLLGRIRENIRRMGNLIDDLLRFSRLSREELVRREVDMEALVRNVVDDLRRDHPGPAAVSIGPLPSGSGDLDLLRQVWTNLVSNAIKYSGTRSDPRIEITGRDTGEGLEYTVTDNGVGFDMAYADKLFGVFQRLHRQDEFEGTGVGLAIVQRIVHRHGGTVHAEASPGNGARFWFTLPRGAVHA